MIPGNVRLSGREWYWGESHQKQSQSGACCVVIHFSAQTFAIQCYRSGADRNGAVCHVCACKGCPHEAQVMTHPVVARRRTLLAQNCAASAKNHEVVFVVFYREIGKANKVAEEQSC